MTEASLTIPVKDILLEARYQKGTVPRTALLCHPHPLYGGNMDNNVVLALGKAVQRMGWSTLRFNFRGVGLSGGEYDEGNGEVEDVLAAAAYLGERESGELHLMGYSFGAWVALRALGSGLDAASLILVSPPVDVLPFDGLSLPEKPCLITLGDRDTFCPVRSLEQWLAAETFSAGMVEVEILPGYDHFYWGHEEPLGGRIEEFLKRRF